MKSGERAHHGALLALLVLPWLWPLATGPSPNVVPLLLAWACALAACGLLLTAPPARDSRAVLPVSWLLAAAISAVIGLAQWFGVAPATDAISPARVGEAYGNLRQRNQFATLTSLGLSAALAFATPGRWRHLLPCVVLLSAANAASASRTGLLQWLVIPALAALWPGPRRERLLLCAAALAAYALAQALLPAALLQWRGVAPATALERAFSDLGCSSRVVLWSNVLELVAQRPWTGWGPGELDYAHYSHLYAGDRFCDILDNAHNLPLHVAVELGVPASLLLVGAVIWALARSRPWRETDATRQAAWAGLAMVGLHSLLEYPLWYGPFQLALLGALVLLLPMPRALLRRRGLAACAMVAGLAALAGLYARYDLVSDAYRAPEQRRAWTRHDPVAAIGEPWPFGTQMRFARLAVTPLARANASELHALALEMLHYSPEPAVIEKVIESAVLLGREHEAVAHAARYRAAFPDRYAQWSAGVRGGRQDVR